MRRLLSCGMSSIVFILLFVGRSHADSFVYTFEEPLFLGGQFNFHFTPPNIAPRAFTTNFTCGICLIRPVSIFGVFSDELFSGQVLFPATASDTLTLTFSEPISELSVNFGLPNVFPSAPAGRLRLSTPVGTLDATSTNLGPDFLFQGGTLVFSSATPFTTATLRGFSGVPSTVFMIDNLVLASSVSESDSSTLIVFASPFLAALLYRKRMRSGFRHGD